jgi:hypothetical protein
MTTRGVKRLASISVGANMSPGGSNNEPKKRRRHNLMFDAIRKAAKKREQNQKLSGEKACSIYYTYLIIVCFSCPKEDASNARYSWAVCQNAQVYACRAQPHEVGQGPERAGTTKLIQAEIGATTTTNVTAS